MIEEKVEQAFTKALDILKGTDLNEFRSFLLECRDRLTQPMQVAVIGEICSSKSTLVNGMLGAEDVVRVGSMEETYNVSWLKYGDPESDIVVHYKEPAGSSENVPRKKWADWANRKGQASFQDNVAYIEVAHDSAALKRFNIIDTPGLNAYHGADSRNTVEFLQKVRPDAVVLLFTKSIAQRSVDLLNAFQGPLLSQMSPVNAVGVLAKVDGYWPEAENPLEAGERVAQRLFTDESAVRSSLYQLHPVCAGLALGAGTLSEEDMVSFQQLSQLASSELTKLLKTVKRFTSEKEGIPVSAEERARLNQKFTRYGVACAVDFLREIEDPSTDQLQTSLLCKSGFDVFTESVVRHFGNRSFLIKLAGVFSDIQRRVAHEKSNSPPQQSNVIREISQLFTDLSLQQHELRELDLLRKVYSGECSLEEAEEEEVLRVTGEYGSSCAEKLGLDPGASLMELLKRCDDRNHSWHRKSIEAADIMDLDRETVCKALEFSYRSIREEIRLAGERLNKEREFLWGSVSREEII